MGKVLSAFTAKAIEAAKEVTLTERISRGLRLVAGKSARTWVYRYDWEARQRQVTLGSWPTMGIAEARRRFAELKAGRKSGVDPAVVILEMAGVDTLIPICRSLNEARSAIAA